MSLRGLMSMVVVFGFVIVGVFYYLNRTVRARACALGLAAGGAELCLWQPQVDRRRLLTAPPRVSPPARPPLQVVPRVQGAIPKRDKKKKEPMGVAESFAFLAKNPYIRDLAFLVRPAAAVLGPAAPRARSLAAALLHRSWPVHSPCPSLTPPRAPSPAGGGLRHLHQPGGGDLEVQDQGPVPQPQRLLRLHGRLLHRHRRRGAWRRRGEAGRGVWGEAQGGHLHAAPPMVPPPRARRPSP